MKNRFASIGSFFLLTFMVIYIVLNPSYQRSLQAKYYFEIGEYEDALVLAKEAFSLDVYNRMSSTIMSQSIIALKYKDYIDMARDYSSKIEALATQQVLLDKDRARIRLMCEIMVDSYKKLSPSIITDKELVDTASGYYLKFENLLEKVTQ